MKETTVPAPTEKNVPDTREETRTLKPPVDIFETDTGLVVVADLPGVDKDSIEVDVEKNILTLKACPAQNLKDDFLRQEYQLQPFFRQFQLSERVDQAGISAEMKYGVLSIHLPKVKEQQPRKIDVTVAQ
ncbi:MAG: Hsp20/alpha crystallin family protein [Candidatus Hydrogenedens sp.]|jgi:HSP20 family molecular chaperone IbpA|nr:Hsp20/alpha crystallin family protein [Candidatus Hydrogenedens sp.]